MTAAPSASPCRGRAHARPARALIKTARNKWRPRLGGAHAIGRSASASPAAGSAPGELGRRLRARNWRPRARRPQAPAGGRQKQTAPR